MLWLSNTVYSQKVTRDEWRKQIQAQETTINDYVDKQLNGADRESLLKQFYASIESHKGEIKTTSLPGLLNNYLRDHFRAKYLKENPDVMSIYNPGRVELQKSSNAAAAPAANIQSVACFNGDFESDPSLSNYTGFRGPSYYGGECSFVPASAVAYSPIPLLSSPNEFQLTNNVADPLIPALNQTNNFSAHAIRINGSAPCPPSYGVNMLQRSFVTPTSGLYRISFSYALVMENPKYHQNLQPFFVARVLNGSGVEVGSRICRVADLTNPIYNITGYMPNPTGCGTTDSLVWRDWTCASIQFQGDPTQTYSIEFFAVDCGAGGHFGYAYVDDICASECCPKFFMRDCCDMHGGSSSGATGRSAVNPASNSLVEKILAEYNTRMALKYNFAANRAAAAIDPCCNPCAYPNDPYPVFIMDEFNNLISSTDYIISWSHDPGNTSAYAYLLPNQQTIVTVKGPGNCVWTDTLKLNCCNDTIKITPFCTWDPCKYPTSPFPVRVKDQNGNTLTSSGGYTFFWQYVGGTSTGDAITATLANFPVIVTVKYPNGCEYTDTLEMNCCTANTPKNPRCKEDPNGSHLVWDPVPGAHYQVVFTIGDPDCCGPFGQHPYTITWNVNGNDTLVPTTFANCYSWYVVSICPDGSKSQASDKVCSCNPVVRCDPKEPVNLKCDMDRNGSRISWDPVPNATYKVIITRNDPDCCHSSNPGLTTVWYVSGTDTIVPATMGCFSWYVVSVCPDGSESPDSRKMCSCSPIPPCDAKEPVNLKCDMDRNGSRISWDPVPNATYKVIITKNDPDCCHSPGPGATIVWYVTGTDTIVPASIGCFSWYVVSICPDGSESPDSRKMCSCSPIPPCDAKEPVNLKCEMDRNGSYISWDPVPNAYYQVYININDPNCCRTNNPAYTLVWDVYGTDTIIPTSVAGCFSWYVVSVCPDGSVSPKSQLMCSCSPVVTNLCDDPYKLKCSADQSGVKLGWAIPAGAGAYELEITYNDPNCCITSAAPNVVVVGIAANTYFIPYGGWKCFSWRVRAKCNAGGYSNWVYGGCNCSIFANPANPTARQGNGQGTGSITDKNVSLEVVPNPASDYVDFNLHGIENAQIQSLEISIHDVTGREVMRKSVNADAKVKFDVTSLSSGMYIYKLIDKKEVIYSGKVLIKK